MGNLTDRLFLDSASIDLLHGSVRRLDGVVRKLSALEVKLLTALANHGENGCSRQEIMGTVWGYHPETTSRTLDVAIRRLRRKIELDPSKPSHLQTVHGHGYRLVEAVAGRAPSTTRPKSRRLPGRDRELETLSNHLEEVGGTVGLVGAPGVGKTSLARALASRWPNTFPVYIPDLGDQPLLDGVARALGIGTSSAKEEAIPQVLRSLRRPLVVLDLKEGPSAKSEVVDAWCLQAPDARFIVCSRSALTLDGHIVRIAPLALPEPDDDLEDIASNPAVEVLVSAAKELRPTFTLTAKNVEAVCEIARLLDGLPLALCTLGHRMAIIGPEALRVALREELPRDVAGRRDAWWTALGESNQQRLSQLSVFQGTFTASEAGRAMGLPAEDAAETIEQLVACNLVEADGELSFRLLYLTRECARHNGIDADARTAHLALQTARAQDLWRLDSPEGGDVLKKLERARYDLARAAEHALAIRHLDAAATCATGILAVARRSGPPELGLDLGRRIAETGVEGIAGAWLWLALGHAERTVDADAAKVALRNALAMAEAARHTHCQVSALVALSQLASLRGNMAEAWEAVEFAVELAGDKPRSRGLALLQRGQELLGAHKPHREAVYKALRDFAVVGDVRHEAVARTMLARGGDEAVLQDAVEQLEAARATYVALGDQRQLAYLANKLGEVQLRVGRLDAAEDALGEALELSRRMGLRAQIAWCLGGLGRIAAMQGRYEASTVITADAEHLALEIPDSYLLATLSGDRAATALERGYYRRAAALWKSAHDAFLEQDSPVSAAIVRGNLAGLHLAEGRFEEAAKLAGETCQVIRQHPGAEGAILGVVAVAKAALGAPEAQASANRAAMLLTSAGELYELTLLRVRCAESPTLSTPENRAALIEDLESLQLSSRAWLAKRAQAALA